MSDIFISYSRKDMGFAQEVVDALAKKRLDTWADWKSIPKGEDWEQKIYEGIETANVFLFLISPNSVRSRMCRREIRRAVKNGNRILPIVIADTDANTIPRDISRIKKPNWIFCRDGQDDFNVAIKETLKTINTNYEWLQFRKDLQSKALEWERNGYEESFLLLGKELQGVENQLVANEDKEPHPTDLQNAYVVASRIAEEKQKAEKKKARTWLGNLWRMFIGVAVVAFIAAVSAIWFRSRAKTSSIHEEIAKATAQADATTRVAAQIEAAQQSNIALGRKLADESLNIPMDTSALTIQRGLLAIEALRLYPSTQADRALHSAISVLGTPVYSSDGKIYLSDDARLIVSVERNVATVSETANKRQRSKVAHSAAITDAVISSNDEILATLDGDNLVKITEINSNFSRAIQLNGKYTNLATSSDGRFLAIWSTNDDKVQVFETTTGKLLSQIAQETGTTIGEVEFSSDGGLMAVGNFDTGRVDVANTATGRHISSFQQIGNIFTIQFSPDGKYIGSGGTVDGAHIWESQSGKEICRASSGNIYHIDFSSDNQRIVLASGVVSEGEASVWDILACKEIARMDHHGAVIDANFSADGTIVISGSDDGTARVWNASTGEEISCMIQDGEITSARFIKDTNMVISISGASDESQSAMIWFPRSHEYLALHHDAGVTSAGFSPDGTKLATGTVDGTINVWETAFGDLIYKFHQNGSIEKVNFLPDGNRVISSSADGTICVWDIRTGKKLNTFGNNAAILASAISTDGKNVISGDVDGNAIVWDIASGKEISQKSFTDQVWAVALSPNGQWAAAGGNDDLVSAWNIKTSKEVASYYHDFWVNDIKFSPDGTQVLSSSNDKTSRVWDIQSNKEISRMLHDDRVWVSVFTPNARLVASSGADKTVRLWDASTGREVGLIRQDGEVGTIVFSKDGQWIITGTSSGEVGIWNANTFQQYSAFQHAGQKISDIEISPDDNYIAASTYSNYVYIWSWKEEYLINRLCQLLPRNLTMVEWKEYLSDTPYHPTCAGLPSPGQ